LETIELIVWLAWNVKFKIGCSTTTTVDLFTQLEACDLIKEATLEKDKTEKSRKVEKRKESYRYTNSKSRLIEMV